MIEKPKCQFQYSKKICFKINPKLSTVAFSQFLQRKPRFLCPPIKLYPRKKRENFLQQEAFKLLYYHGK